MMVVTMTVVSTICISVMTYALGRVHGYEKKEQDNKQIDSFWKEVEKDGL